MLNQCHIGDCRRLMRDMIAAGVKVQTVVTSPPYWGLRDYGVDGQLGLEASPVRYLARMRSVFRLVRELLADDGTVWLNMGDSYYSPRVGGATGVNSTINGKATQQAFKDAQRAHRSKVQQSNLASTKGGMNRRRGINGLKPKDLVGMPWMLALLLRADGWYLRQDIIWHKKNPMPESTKDRCTKAHEYLFLLAKSERYYFDQDAIKESRVGAGDAGVSGWASGSAPHNAVSHNRQKGDAKTFRGGQYVNSNKFHNSHARKRNSTGNRNVTATTRNRRSVWDVATEPCKEAHFATFPRALIRPCILAGSRPGDVVFDPFLGSGTTAEVAENLGRQWLGCEINPDYLPLQRKRLQQSVMVL